MIKTGILSMQRIINYGSFLQAYALKKMLEEQDCEVQFVDYRVGKPLIEDDSKKKNGFMRKVYKTFDVLSYDAPFLHKVQYILYKKQFPKKYHKYLGLSCKFNYTPELDVLVIGSDEVFNCVQKNSNVGYSIELFGAKSKTQKLITYAASFGNTTIDKLCEYKKIDEIRELLKKFDSLSVRDENTARIVRKLTGKDVIYHLDPVLVYDYIGKCKYIPKLKIKEKYLILYAYSGRISKEESKYISSYARSMGLKIYAIGGIQKCADRFINCSPFEVLSYFENAEEIITDTFHGTIFSIITNRQFMTLIRKSVGNAYGNEEKLIYLLEQLGLSNRTCYFIEEMKLCMKKEINYMHVHEILQKERKKALDYLRLQINGDIA